MAKNKTAKPALSGTPPAKDDHKIPGELAMALSTNRPGLVRIVPVPIPVELQRGVLECIAQLMEQNDELKKRLLRRDHQHEVVKEKYQHVASRLQHLSDAVHKCDVEVKRSRDPQPCDACTDGDVDGEKCFKCQGSGYLPG